MLHLIEINDNSFEKNVLISNLPTLVDFWAPWCGPCRSLTPVLEKVSENFKERLKIFKINVDDNPQTPANYSVLSIPCLIFFNKGEAIGRLVGFMDEKKLNQEIEEILKKL